MENGFTKNAFQTVETSRRPKPSYFFLSIYLQDQECKGWILQHTSDGLVLVSLEFRLCDLTSASDGC
jgi:hypothetical protein